MRVPRRIELKILNCAKYSAKAYESQKIIRDWFRDNNIANDDVIDQFIDRVETNGNDPDGFIEFLKSGDFDVGNNSLYEEKDGEG